MKTYASQPSQTLRRSIGVWLTLLPSTISELIASPIRFHKFPAGLHRGTMTKNTKTKTICTSNRKAARQRVRKHCVSFANKTWSEQKVARAHSPSTQTSPAVGEIWKRAMPAETHIEIWACESWWWEILSVQVSHVAVDVYCDSHNNPAGRSKGCVVGFVIICKTNARKSHVEQIHCRSDVEYPSSVLLKALHLVHAHHCHKACKEIKRPGTRVKESVRRNLLSPIQVRDKPTKNEHEKRETKKGI